MKKIIILGRSPFISSVNLQCLKYDLGCINKPPCKVKYCFCIDGVKFPVDKQTKIISPKNGYNIIPAPNFDTLFLHLPDGRFWLYGSCRFHHG